MTPMTSWSDGGQRPGPSSEWSNPKRSKPSVAPRSASRRRSSVSSIAVVRWPRITRSDRLRRGSARRAPLALVSPWMDVHRDRQPGRRCDRSHRRAGRGARPGPPGRRCRSPPGCPAGSVSSIPSRISLRSRSTSSSSDVAGDPRRVDRGEVLAGTLDNVDAGEPGDLGDMARVTAQRGRGPARRSCGRPPAEAGELVDGTATSVRR